VVEKLNEARDSIVPSLGATSTPYPPARFRSNPRATTPPINQTILRAPASAEDSFGSFTSGGAQPTSNSASTGILLPEGITGFGMELDSRFIDSVSLIDGALPAQFGFKTAGIIDITTRMARN